MIEEIESNSFIEVVNKDRIIKKLEKSKQELETLLKECEHNIMLFKLNIIHNEDELIYFDNRLKAEKNKLLYNIILKNIGFKVITDQPYLFISIYEDPDFHITYTLEELFWDNESRLCCIIFRKKVSHFPHSQFTIRYCFSPESSSDEKFTLLSHEIKSEILNDIEREKMLLVYNW